MPRHWLLSLGISAAFLLALVGLGVSHYDWNVSGLLHMDTAFGEIHEVPAGVVLYEDGGYDGMLYYQVARDIPTLFFGGEITLDSPYRFQRILFPLFGYLLTFGNAEYLSIVFLLINILAVLGSFLIFLRITKRLSVHALTIVFNPASLVGILYMLTEPVSLFFLMLFFFVWEKAGRRIDIASLFLITLSLFARETTVFLIGLLGLWALWKRQWKDAFLLGIPLVLLILWQYFLSVRFGSIGFQANSNILDFPFTGPITVIKWAIEQNGLEQFYRLSSVALLMFVLPLTFFLGKKWIKNPKSVGIMGFLLSGLTLFYLSMDTHMWGVITSIGRVVTPFYPVYALYAAENDSPFLRSLSGILIAVSLVAALGIASVPHPFVFSS